MQPCAVLCITALLPLSILGRGPGVLERKLQRILAKATATYPGPYSVALSLGVSLPDNILAGFGENGLISLSSGPRKSTHTGDIPTPGAWKSRLCRGDIPTPGDMPIPGASCVHHSDKFAMGSTAKMYTAAAVLRLVDQGKFGLDDKALPLFDALWTRLNGTSILDGLGPYIKEVTVRQLLGMRSGIPDFDNKASRQYQFNHPEEDLGPVQEVSFLFPVKNFSCSPGQCGEYSSTNYELLGLLLAQQAGKTSWDEYTQQDDLPLLPEMTSTSFALRGPCSKYTHVHAYSREQTPAVDVSNMSCANGWTCGNLISNAADAAFFVRALLSNGGRILTRSSQQEMLKFVPLTSKAWGFGLPYGLGLMDLAAEFNLKDSALVGHAGETYGFNAITAYAKEYDFGVSVVANSENGTLTWEVLNEAYGSIVDFLNTTALSPLIV